MKDAKPETIHAFNDAQVGDDQQICQMLRRVIDRNLTGAESKIWHAHPVWFLDGNPIVGYSKLKSFVRLLFWSGQSLKPLALPPKAALRRQKYATRPRSRSTKAL